MVTNSGEIFHPSSADHYNRMLLQIMAFTRYIRCYFESIGQSDTGNLPQSRVRLLRRGCIDPGADATFLWTGLHCRGFALPRHTTTAFPYELVNSWQVLLQQNGYSVYRYSKKLDKLQKKTRLVKATVPTSTLNYSATAFSLERDFFPTAPSSTFETSRLSTTPSAGVTMMSENLLRPVPAGIRCPMITFSFRPSR